MGSDSGGYPTSLDSRSKTRTSRVQEVRLQVWSTVSVAYRKERRKVLLNDLWTVPGPRYNSRPTTFDRSDSTLEHPSFPYLSTSLSVGTGSPRLGPRVFSDGTKEYQTSPSLPTPPSFSYWTHKDEDDVE